LKLRNLALLAGFLALPLPAARAAVVFSDSFSDGSASDWRVRGSTGTAVWTVVNDNPTGEPAAASQWLYNHTNTATFSFLQSAAASGFSAPVNATQTVRLSAGFQYLSTIPNRVDLYLMANNADWTSASFNDDAYGVRLANSTGTTASFSILKRDNGVETQLGTATAAISLTAGTYYSTRLEIASGGALTVSVFDAGGALLATTSGTDTGFSTFASTVVHFRQGSMSTGFRVSDLQVETMAVPEVGSAAWLGAAGLLLGLRRVSRKGSR
jgi:hypothetical protein